jgi:hypothetical protein
VKSAPGTIREEWYLYLLSLPPSHAWPDFAQYLAHPQNAVYEHAIGRALDFEVAEEGVGAEEGKYFVERIVRLM